MSEPELPHWLRNAIIGFVTLLLAMNILLDVFHEGYDGQFVTIMLGGIVGATVGIKKIYKGGDDQ